MSMRAMDTGVIEIQAHRGASGDLFENTIAAFEEGFKQGANSVELDVHLSCDNEVIVNHDYDILDLRNKEKRLIRELSLNEINDISRAAESINSIKLYPSLREVFKWFVNYLKNGSQDLILDIEIKGDKKFSNERDKIIDSVMALINDFGIINNIRIRSFYPYVLLKLRKKYPDIHRVLLTNEKMKHWDFLAKFLKAHSVAPNISRVDPKRIRRAKKMGLYVMVWGANNVEDFRRLVDMGVDLITTDYPYRLKVEIENLNRISSGIFIKEYTNSIYND